VEEDKSGPQRLPAQAPHGADRPVARARLHQPVSAETGHIEAEHRVHIAETARVTEAARRAAAERRAAAADQRAAESTRRAVMAEAAFAAESGARAEAERRAAERADALAAETAARSEVERRAVELRRALAAETAARATAERTTADLEQARAAEALQRAEAEQRAAAIERAAYWRATHPLRTLTGRLPPGLRRLIRRGAKLAWWTVTLRLPSKIRARRSHGSTAIARTEEPEQLPALAVDPEVPAAAPAALPDMVTSAGPAPNHEIAPSLEPALGSAIVATVDAASAPSPPPAAEMPNVAPSFPREMIEAAHGSDLLAQAKIKRALLERFGPEAGFQAYRETLQLLDTDHVVHKPLRTLRDFAFEQADAFREVAPAGERFVIVPPRVIGESDRRPIGGISSSFFVACLNDARVRGRSGLVEAGGAALLDCADIELMQTDRRLSQDPAIFDLGNGQVWVIRPTADVCSMEIDEAFTLLGPSSYSFRHWMAEFLPRYVAALVSGVLPPVPVMIDKADDGLMPRTHRQAMDLLLPQGTELIQVPPLATVRVGRLWCARSSIRLTAQSWTGTSLVSNDLPLNNLTQSPVRLTPLVLDMVSHITRWLGPGSGPERIFLARRPYRDRKLGNRTVIEAIAEARGFRVLYPEDMPFLDQVHLVRSARFVIAPEGAAVFLALFARPGTQICIVGPPASVGEPMLTTLLAEVGVDCEVIPGRAVGTQETPGATTPCSPLDYELDETNFSSILDRWIRGERP
jgi:Glycosyltransferase 61